MAGHGSLCPRNPISKSPFKVNRSKCGLTWIRVILFPLLVTMLAGEQVFASDAAPQLYTSQNQTLDVALDFEWTSQDSQYCHLRLKLMDQSAGHQCVIRKVENLSDSDDTVAAFNLTADGKRLDIQPRGQVKSVRFRLFVRGTKDTRVTVDVLADPRNPETSQFQRNQREMSLNEILKTGTLSSGTPITSPETGQPKPTWSIRRAVTDELRISGLPVIPIYEPGATLELTAAINAMNRHSSSVLTLHYSIIQVSSQKTIERHRRSVSVNTEGNSETIPISVIVPDAPGVYEISCHLSEDDERIWDRLRRRESRLLKTGRPFFVLPGKESTTSLSTESWTTAGTIRPSESNWSVGQWLPKTTTRFIPGVNSAEPTNQLGKTQHGDETVSILSSATPFQATLPILTPGNPHKITLRLPATQNVKLQIQVGGLYDRDDPATDFVLNDTKSIDSNEQWRTCTFVHYPAKDDQIWLTNLSEDELLIESIDVQAGPPALTKSANNVVAQPVFNQHRTSILHLDDIEWVESLSKDVATGNSYDEFDIQTIQALKLWVALHRICDLAKANGMNGIMFPANTGGKTLFQTRSMLPRKDSRYPESNQLALAIALMANKDLTAQVRLDPNFQLTPVEQAIRENPDLIQQFTRTQNRNVFQYNLLHPLVQDNLQKLVAELTFQCSDFEHFAGITINCGSNSHLQPIRQIFSDDATLIAFAKSLKVNVNIEQLRSWSQTDGRSTYEKWVMQATNLCFQQLQSIDPQISLNLQFEPHQNSARKTDAASLLTFQPDETFPVAIGRSFAYREPPALVREMLRVPSKVNEPESGATTFFDTAMQVNQVPLVQPESVILEDTCHLIERRDPGNLVITLPLHGRVLQSELATLLQTFQAMPRKGLESVEVASKAQNVVCLKRVQSDGYLYLACLCLTPWANDLEVKTSQPVEWELIGGNPNDFEIEKLGKTTARFKVPEGKLILLRSRQPAAEIQIVSCKTRLSGGSEALAEIKSQVTLIAQRIGILFDFDSYDALNNGSFENANGMGLVGWLHAQHPAGCVRVDDAKSLAGKNSILLTTETNTTARTWLVSETITPPESGRLAVSLACLAETGQNIGTHRLRVSLEATVDEKPVRYSSEFDIPKNGKWGNREVRLEALNIDASKMHSLRLTIDSLSSGRIWIDDIRLHDQFPTISERDELQSEAFLAVQGLQKNNLAPAGRLLQNGWAQHLLKLSEIQTTAPATTEVDKTEPQDAPGIAERIRDWIPRTLRF